MTLCFAVLFSEGPFPVVALDDIDVCSYAAFHRGNRGRMQSNR